MSTYNHTFLGGFDALGQGRVIEPSSFTLDHSYFGIPQNPVFEGKVFGKPEIIFQLPLDIGLSIEVGTNYIVGLDQSTSLAARHHLLALSN